MKKILKKLKNINQYKIMIVLNIIIKIMFLITITIIAFKLHDLYTKYHKVDFKLYEIKRGNND